MSLVKFRALALQIRPKIASDVRAFAPVQAEPLQPFVNGGHCFLGVALDVGVFDAEHEFSAMVPRKKPIEERSARPADVQMASRRGGETNADFRAHLATDYTDFHGCCSGCCVSRALHRIDARRVERLYNLTQ